MQANGSCISDNRHPALSAPSFRNPIGLWSPSADGYMQKALRAGKRPKRMCHEVDT